MWLDLGALSATFIIDLTFRLLLAARVIMRRRPVPVTLAWLFVLAFPLPFVGALAYLVLGEVRLGGRRFQHYLDLTAEFTERARVFWRARSQEWSPETRPYRHVADVLTQIGHFPPLRGNSLEFVAGSQPFLDGLIRDIDAAQARVHLLFFIWMHKSSGVKLAEAVERAAKRGVECRVLIDAHGSKRFLRGPWPARMRAAGAKVAEALPVNPLRMLLARVDLRNHRKIAVIDGVLAWTGSSNITDAMYGWTATGKRKGPWIDAMVRLTGPAAQALDVVFLRDWIVETEEFRPDQLEALIADVAVPEHGSSVHVVPTGPDPGAPGSVRDAIVTLMFAARREIIMTTPYFVPDEATREALVAAAMRGVQVTMVLPRTLDQYVVGAASRSHLDDLLAYGVRIFLHTRGLLHSKTITVDSDVGMIGSHNLDARSFYLNFELSLFIYDDAQASVLRQLQQSYLAESVEIFCDEWRARPLWKRFLENCARLLGPLL